MNKPLKRVTSLFLMLLMFLTLVGPINLMAASNIGSARILDITYTVLSTGKTIEVARHFVDGQQAWCVDSSKIQLSGVSKTVETLDDYNRLSETVKRKIELIDYYAHQIGAGTSDQIYVTGQFMIWEQTNNIDFNHYSFSNGLNNEEFLNIRKQIQTLIDNHYVIPSFDGTKLEATVGKPITLTDTNGVLEKFVFSSSDTSIATVIQSGNILTITPKASGPVTVSARKIPAEYTGTSLLFSNGDLWQDTAQLKIKDPLRSFLSLEVESLGNLVLGKVDENNKSIPNTTFDLSRNSNMSEVLGSYTTEENGKVAINDLEAGTYYVQETWVPSPLILDSTVHKVVVNPSETTTFTATNNLAKGRIEITKTDSDSEEVLSGAVYEVYDSLNRLVDTLTTQANGKAISAELPLGTYSVKEIKAPIGYLLSDEVHPVSLVYKDQVTPVVSVSLSVTNEEALGQITITKNGIDNEIVIGAKFDIFNDSNKKVDTITTGSNGKATSKALPLGDYKLIETFVPEPYLLDQTPISASLLYKDQITAVVTAHVSQKNEVAKGQFTLQKTDAENGDVLADAIFEVSDVDNKLVATLTTDASGKVTSPILPLGKYTVKEVKAPVGFNLDNQKYEVELLYEDQLTPLMTTHLDLTNQPIKGKIQIVKINAQDEEVPIPNVVFDVLSLPDRTFIEKITTDQNGFAYTSDLRYGEYLLLEVEAPQEFYLNTNEYTVLIRENEKTEVQYISNDQVLLKLQLQKIDGDSQQPLSDSVWEISNKRHEEWNCPWEILL